MVGTLQRLPFCASRRVDNADFQLLVQLRKSYPEPAEDAIGVLSTLSLVVGHLSSRRHRFHYSQERNGIRLGATTIDSDASD